ncbi:recombinase family protein [Streptomyces sp. YS-3]|uniref:recombinase family protein n=1 Tax=Streptomyces sp. YS-3 TaxID=3381352 RepID=UPI003862947D
MTTQPISSPPFRPYGPAAWWDMQRVSTEGQLLDRQIHVLTEAGCIRIFSDKESGKNAEREELWKALDYHLLPVVHGCGARRRGQGAVLRHGLPGQRLLCVVTLFGAAVAAGGPPDTCPVSAPSCGGAIRPSRYLQPPDDLRDADGRGINCLAPPSGNGSESSLAFPMWALVVSLYILDALDRLVA